MVKAEQVLNVDLDEPIFPDDPPAVKAAKLERGQPIYDPTTDTYKPTVEPTVAPQPKPVAPSGTSTGNQFEDLPPLKTYMQTERPLLPPNRAANLILGAFKAIPKMVESERYVKTYQALEERQDKILKDVEKARESGPFSGALEFTYNAMRDAGDIMASIFVLGDALIEASSKSPEDVAEFLSTIPPAIAAGTYQVISDPIESLETDPVGTYLTLSGFGNLLRAGKLASFATKAARRAPEPIRTRAQASFEGMDRFMSKVGNKKMEDILPLSTPLSRGQKTVGEGAPRRRLDVPSGEEALRVGDVIKGAVVPGVIGLGSYGVPGAVAGMLGSAVIRTTVSAAKSAGPNTIGQLIGSLERLVKSTSRAQNISEGVAKSVIMSEAAKAGSKLHAQLNKIEDAIRNGDLDNAAFYMKDLDAPIRKATVETTVRPGVVGAQATTRRTTGNVVGGEVKARRLPDSIQKPLDDALKLIDDVVGKRSQFVNNEINRIARLDSTMLLGNRVIRQGVIKNIAKTINRKLTNAEARIITQKMNQMASLARLSNKDISGIVRIGNSRIDLSKSIQRTMRELRPKSQRDVIIQAVGSVMQKEMTALRAQSFINAIEDSAMAPVRGRKYAGRSLEDQLKEFVPSREGSRPAYVRADVLREYAEAIAESVIIKGNTVPLAMPRGVSYRQVRDILDNPNFQDYFRAKHNIKAGDKTYDNALRSLIEGMPDGVRIGDNATIPIFKNELDALRQSMADLQKSGGLLDDADLRFLDELEDSLRIQRGPRADKHNGPEVHPELGKTLDWVSNWKADATGYSRMLNTMAGVWRGARTIGSVGTGIINNLANAMISSIENGVFVPQMYMRYADEVVLQSRYHRGNTKGFTPDELAYAKMTDELGFSRGDMTQVELRNFLRGSDVNSVLSAGRLSKLADEAAYLFSTNKIAEFLKQGAVSTGRNARKFYSSGDTVPKRVHAKASMRETVGEIRRMEPGSVFFVRTNENVIRKIKRLENGQWTYNGKKISPNNLAAKENKKFRDIIMANARRRANNRFVDFASRPGLMRIIDRMGLAGAIADPFITWGMKAKGIGGPNLMDTVLGLGRAEYITDSAAVSRSLAMKHAAKRLRSAAILQTTRVDQAQESRRRALDLLNSYASRTSLGTIIGLETEGMALTRDLGNLVSTNEANKLRVGALQILASIFEESPDSDKVLAAQGKPDTPVMNAILNTLDVAGFATDATAIKIVNDIIRNDARKNQRAWRELRRSAMSTTGNEVFEYIVGLLKDSEALPDWADEMLPTTYFDFIHRNTPAVQRPSRLRNFFVRNSGKLLAEQTMIYSNLGEFGRMGKLERNANRIKKHLIKIYFEPVRKEGSVEDQIEAWGDIRDWYNNMLIESSRGYFKSVQSGNNPLNAEQTKSFEGVLEKLFMPELPPIQSLQQEVRQRILSP